MKTMSSWLICIAILLCSCDAEKASSASQLADVVGSVSVDQKSVPRACDIRMDVVGIHGEVLKLDASECDPGQATLSSLIKPKLSSLNDLSNVTAVAITMPSQDSGVIGAWDHACRSAKFSSWEIKPEDFLAAYNQTPQAIELQKMLDGLGLKLRRVSVDNFYPLRNATPSNNKGCDARLLSPVVWYEK